MDAGLTGPLRPLNPMTSAAAPKAGEAVSAPAESVEARSRKRRVQEEEAERDRQRRRRQQPPDPAPDDAPAAGPPAARALVVDPALSEHIGQAPSGGDGLRAYHEKLAGGGAAVSHRVEKLA